jgi:hypothetical protein
LVAPTRLLGMVDDRQYGTLVTDVYEHIPDLYYPNSVEIYAQMRRDAQLAGAVGGYTLQLRRSQWQLDGTGCRPEVTRLVADGLGLNVVGEDQAGAARRRGVSWNEHLRAALLSLVWGHYGFELEAEVVDGVARLATLAERIPGTISAIHADPKTGALLGVDQLLTTRERSPQIPASRLAWYCHEREGSGWQGVSLLRAAYAPWLIKREMMRVNAISNRRWGAGVPVAEALPGTNPTGAQIAEAQRLASAARAGDQAGAALPAGFTLKIVGLSGNIPDTLGFINFLNQEMSRSVLMQHMDLGSTQSGSRALGAAFIDSWTLALESIGEGIADTATRQIAERIVDWNWGTSEPVPRVVVSGVGSRREVTAASLDLLLRSGALSAEPGLEAWVRREYRLPERTQPAPPTPPTPPPAPPVAARRAPRRSRKEPSPGQLALPILATRQPTPEETAAGVNPAVIEQQWQQQVDELAAQWEQAADPVIEEIVAAVAAAVATGALADLIASGALAVSAEVLAGLALLIAAGMLTLAQASADQVVKEVAAHGVVLDSPTVDAAVIDAQARAAAQVIAAGYVNGAAQEALANDGPDADPTVVAERVREHLDGVTSTATSDEQTGRGWVMGSLAQVLSRAQGAGRLAAFEALQAAGHAPAYVASEVNDRNECLPCSKIDGTRFETLTEATAAYPNGQYVACLGRCRGFLFVVLPDN